MIKFEQKGDFKKLNSFLEKSKNVFKVGDLDRYGREGVNALSSVTPRDTGETARSWEYKINRTKDRITIEFHNSNIQNGVPIAVIIQYGHATEDGGYVQGRDYINPVIRPLFDKMANDIWKEVSKS